MIYRKLLKRQLTVLNCLSLIGVLVATSFCAIGRGDVVETTGENGDGKRVVTFKMTITPAAQPVPSFKHRLTVREIDQIPGNAITHYLRSLGENGLDNPTKHIEKTYGIEVYNWSSTETATKDVPLEKLRDACAHFDGYVNHHLKRATLCRDCEWGLAEETLRGPNTLGFLLPSIQQTRLMARVLGLRNRLAVMDGRYDDSVEHLRMTYQLGQNVSELKFLVAKLVGIAEVGIANQGMTHLIAADGSPNMYWALAELPQPIINIRDSVRLEASLGSRYFPALMDVETAQHSPAQWNEKLTQLFESMQDVYGLTGQRSKTGGVPGSLLTIGAGLAAYTPAKKRLVKGGMDPAKIEKMAVAHVILLDAARDYQRHADSMEASFYLPYSKSKSHVDRWGKTMRTEYSPTRLGALLANLLLPAVTQVRNAEIRAQAGVNALQAIEAIRDHVARTGKLPAKLDEMELPVRLNPHTGKPFGYEIKEGNAVLLVEGFYHDNVYEIEIASKK